MFMGHVSLLASKEKQPDINLDEVLLNSTGIVFNFEASLVDQVYFVTSQTCAMFPSLYFDLDFFTTDMSRLITKELAMFCFHSPFYPYTLAYCSSNVGVMVTGRIHDLFHFFSLILIRTIIVLVYEC